MSIVQVIAVGLVGAWATTLAFFVGIWVACLVMERRLRRWEMRDMWAEANAILHVAEQVRAVSPPLPPEFLADLVSEACESQRSNQTARDI